MPQQNHTPITDLIQKRLYVGNPAKESFPARSDSERAPLQEIIEHKDVDEDVKKHIDIRQEKIEVPEDLKKIGVESVSHPQFTTISDVKIPLEDEKVMTGLHAPIYTSLRWLSLLCMYILQQGHITLKNVGGKVKRVNKR